MAPALATRLDALAAEFGDAPALLSDGVCLSYRELAGRVNQGARWALSAGVGRGTVVGLLMPGGPEYVALWLGITRVGGVVALLNPALGSAAQLHWIDAAGARFVITTPPDRDGFSAAPLDHPGPGLADRALLIFTSGTTGMPKAVNLTHGRVLEWSLWFAGLMDARATDRIYNCLPLYHSVGGVVFVGSMLVAGGSVLLRERFSVGRFWDDVADHACTIFAYIGELCRYLLAGGPPSRTHRLRLACGNGMQGPVWTAFQERFAIPQVLEFYAATEGGLSLYNVDGRVGAIGRIPGYLAHRFPVRLLHCIDGEPVRDAAGRCIVAGPDEPGEAVSRLNTAPDIYTDRAATERKLLRDVVAPGDVWFRSGDLMRRDRAGYFYFLDRLGDTFRWKGENVAASEVQAVAGTCPGVLAAAVYGVTVPGQEGRAGMAALVVGPGFAWDTLHRRLTAALPAYARPVFIRLCPTLESTGTFRPMKTTLRDEGWAGIDDVFTWTEAGYVKLDRGRTTAILQGTLRI